MYRNFTRHGDGREKLLYDYSMDEPSSNCVERKFQNGTFKEWDCKLHWAQIKARAAALHAVDPDLRSLVTTELCNVEERRIDAGKCIEPDGLEAIKHDINLCESLSARLPAWSSSLTQILTFAQGYR
eukprot:COSAG06_NODE_25352_length_639_cov_0.846296_1_plen_127_part_00